LNASTPALARLLARADRASSQSRGPWGTAAAWVVELAARPGRMAAVRRCRRLTLPADSVEKLRSRDRAIARATLRKPTSQIDPGSTIATSARV